MTDKELRDLAEFNRRVTKAMNKATWDNGFWLTEKTEKWLGEEFKRTLNAQKNGKSNRKKGNG